MTDFANRMNDYLSQINQKLDELLRLHGQPYDQLIEAMRYSAMNAGKRIRPILTLEFCRIFGGDVKEALPFACGVEMIHCYSLIHDDLPCMDDDDLRRGKPSCHKAFGEATALLAGDALLTKAFESICNSELAHAYPERGVKAASLLAAFAGADGMVGGQVIDLACEGEDAVVTEEILAQMHSLKTSALIQAACTMGAAAAGANEEQIKIAEAYGSYLGLAFQLVDDILDVTSTEEVLGKPIGSDAEQEKVTMISLLGLEETKKRAEAYTQKALAAVSTLPDPAFLQELTEQLLSRKK